MPDHSMPVSVYEPDLFTALEKANPGPSHGVEHASRVLLFAQQLGAIYGGDSDTLAASAILHDLGRTMPKLHGTASTHESVKLAQPILDSIAFPKTKGRRVVQNILDHDQPSLRPQYLEGRILKDADFLSGVGAMGILRAAMWTGESGGTISDSLERIGRKMRERIDSLEFPESKQYALKEYLFVQLFLDKLQNGPSALEPQRATYIAIEGISGSGKSTQADLLAAHYDSVNGQVLRLSEPTPLYHRLHEIIGHDTADDPLFFLLDRQHSIAPRIKHALSHGTMVIADRSYMSTLVYQSNAHQSAAHIAYMHSHLPQPTHFVVLDLAAETAFARIKQRAKETGRPQGTHETLGQLRTHRKAFIKIAASLPNAHVIDANNKSPQDVHQLIISELGLGSTAPDSGRHFRPHS